MDIILIALLIRRIGQRRVRFAESGASLLKEYFDIAETYNQILQGDYVSKIIEQQRKKDVPHTYPQRKAKKEPNHHVVMFEKLAEER